MNLYTVGTWLWINLITELGKRIATKKFNMTFWNLFVVPGLWVYVSHYPFVTLFMAHIVMPLEMNILPAILLVFVLTQICVIVTYYLLVYIS